MPIRSCKATPFPLATPSWPRDDQNRLVLLRIPPQVDLKSPSDNIIEHTNNFNDDPIPADTLPTNSPSPPRPRKPTNITSLPTEIIHEIANILHPVDRVCLALACKPLASSVLSAPRLCPTSWSRFSDRRYDWFLPESYSLTIRLAHGWIPKDKLRYCWNCRRILPRDEQYFRKRLRCKKNPKWDLKLHLPKERWDAMSKKDRYQYIIETWCQSPSEDSSCLYCDHCRPHLKTQNPELQYPVQCPICLERELTIYWRPPRKPWFRKKLIKCVKCVWAPIELVAYLLLTCCVFGVRIVYNSGRMCWRTLC
ncbi:uncharacterized protein Z518_05020 [Rhinocladiella mackenziei CBS 650.93]|uniref:F-box domain-containing protein n=1 Tax=Rhinocladiella mackenziei CBS 650.93 TaxID=1442369 RepID=A0A0D2H993_9EURO|nr:uncharacterized protein Z518_05020 [Rhinocladiella mackenziei CBS 650.93]KIX07043.1 hypothetical protein Z518_05020 [Rhinocladiella mackenziei CBS 650.93]